MTQATQRRPWIERTDKQPGHIIITSSGSVREPARPTPVAHQ